MKPKVFIIIAITLGVIAALIAARLINVGQATGAKVVVVAQPIDAGRAITTEKIKVVAWPGSDVPQGAFTRTSDAVGRISRVSLIPGEPLLSGKLAPKGATGGLSSIIPPGKRAITVKVNEVIAVAGFALPRSYVDILVNGKDASKQSFSRTVLSRVKVLAVDQITTGDPDKPKVVNAVTLELTPQESEKLDLARNIGRLALVLRNELDTTRVTSSGARLRDIVNPRTAAASSEEKASLSRQSFGPEEIRGTSRSHVANP